MKIFYFIAVLIVNSAISLSGQAGMYSESDIELQDLFIESHLEKQKANYNKQIELLKELVRRDRSAHIAYYEMARAYFQMENSALAESMLSKALKIDASNECYLSLMVEVQESQKKYAAAVGTATTLVKNFPDKQEYHFMLAKNHLSNGQSDEAIKTLLNFQNLTGLTEEISKRIFKIYDSKGKISEAIYTLKALSEKYPGNTRFLSNLAGYLLENGKKSEALRYYERLLQLDPDHPEANLVIAREEGPLNTSQGELSAIEAMIANENISLDDIIKELMPYMSNMDREGEQTEKLKNISLQLLEKYPSEAKTHAVRADILFYSGSISDSEQLYQKAIELDNSKYTLWDQWLINLWELENYNKMMLKSEEAIDFFPNQFYAWFYYALALQMIDNTEDAQEYLFEAKLIAGNKQNFKNACTILESWLDLKTIGSAERLSELSSLNLSQVYSPVLFDLLGEIYYSAGDAGKSKMFWNRAVEFGADEERINRKLGSLN